MTRMRAAAVIAWVVAALASGFALIPGAGEIGLMHWKDRNFDAARQAYEARIKAGERTPEVLGALHAIYLEFGELEEAVAVAEEYLARHPSDIQARLLLDSTYRQAQMIDKYLANAEILSRLAPEPERIRTLAATYELFERYSEQIAVLNRLVQRGWAEPGDYDKLARLLAARGRGQEAADVVAAWRKAQPAGVDLAAVQLLARLRIDAGAGGRAVEEIRAWLGDTPNPSAVASFAGLMLERGHPGLAWKLLEPHTARAGNNDVLLTAVVSTERALGRDGDAWQRLSRLREAKQLPESMWEPYLDLAASRKAIDEIASAIEPARLAALPDWLTVALADVAFAAKRQDVLARLLAAAGDRWSTARPLLAAEIALMRGDKAEALRRAAAAAGTELDTRNRLALASLYERLGDPAAALAQLERTDTSGLSGAERLSLANLYLTRGESARGWTRMNTDVRDAAWALLAVAEGDSQAALEWIGGNGAGEDLLTACYWAAADRGRVEAQWGLAVLLRKQRAPLAAQVYPAALLAAAAAGLPVADELEAHAAARLGDRAAPEPEREALVGALIRAGRPKAAVAEAERLARARGGSWFFAYVDAARAGGETRRLGAFLEKELARTDLTEVQRDERLYVLIDTVSLDRALPWLRRSAGRGADWTSAYESALVALGRDDELHAAWRKRSADPSATAETRRAAAFALLGAGEKAPAIHAFRLLAEQQSAPGPDAQQLLYLWGPRPPAEALDWIEARARGAVDPLPWLDALYYAGAPARAAAVAARLPSPKPELYFRALQQTRDRVALAVAIDREAATVEDVSRLRLLATIALEESLNDSAERAFQRLLRQQPADREALSWLARLTWASQRYESARHYVGLWRQSHEGDAELHLIHGQLLEMDGNKARARTEYEAGAAAAAKREDFEGRLVAAQLRFRLDGLAAAAPLFDALIRERPGDLRLATEWASLQVEGGAAADAGRVLDAAIARGKQPPKEAGPREIEVTIDWGGPLAARVSSNGRELLVRVPGPLPEQAAAKLAESPREWVAGVSGGYDSILVTAARDVEWKWRTDGNRLRVHLSDKSGGADANAGTEGRIDMLRAAIDRAQGRLAQAGRRYETLASAGEGRHDAVLGLASLEYQIGRWRRADQLASSLAEASEPARRLRDEVRAPQRDRVDFGSQSTSIGNGWTQTTARASGHTLLSPSLRLGFELEAGRGAVTEFRQLDGRTRSFDGAIRRGEIFLRKDTIGGSVWRASLFGSQSAGAGLAWERPDAWGGFSALGEYRRPFWGFAEGLAQGGIRDRIELMRRQRIGAATAWVAVSANRYGLGEFPSAASTHGVAGGVAVPLPWGANRLRGEYGFDSERRAAVSTRTGPGGRMFTPLPFASREIHSAGMSTSQPFGKRWMWEAAAGMAVDRLGGRGPYFTGRLAYQAPGGFSVQGFADRRLYNLNTGLGPAQSNAATQVGVSVTWRPGGGRWPGEKR